MPNLRYDIGSLRAPKRMANGYLRADGYLTRIGVFSYRKPDGTETRELRLPEEVFRNDALNSFSQVPVTDNHPSEMLDSRNTKDYAKGVVSEVLHRDDDYLRASLTIYDSDLISKMEQGKTQVSCGYTCDVEAKSGEWHGQKYDAIQRNIRGNHVAIVDVGRAGPDVSVRMDAAYQTLKEGNTMASPTPELNDAITKKLADETVRADNAEKTVKDLAARCDKAEGELASVKAELTELKKARKDEEDPTKLNAELQLLRVRCDKAEKDLAFARSREGMRDAVKARVSIETSATAILGAGVRVDSLDDRALMLAVLEKINGAHDCAERSDDYVRARFDAAVASYLAGESALMKLRAVVNPDSETRVDARTARERMIARNRGLSKE